MENFEFLISSEILNSFIFSLFVFTSSFQSSDLQISFQPISQLFIAEELWKFSLLCKGSTLQIFFITLTLCETIRQLSATFCKVFHFSSKLILYFYIFFFKSTVKYNWPDGTSTIWYNSCLFCQWWVKTKMLKMGLPEKVSKVSLASTEFESQTLVITASSDYTEYGSPKISFLKIHRIQILMLEKGTLYMVLYLSQIWKGISRSIWYCSFYWSSLFF